MQSDVPRIIKWSARFLSHSDLTWLGITILSLAPIFPLSNFAGHPHWDNIRWIPFQDFSFSPAMLRDVFANILWFLPLGMLLYSQLREQSATYRTIIMTALIAGAISLSIESFQVFCHNRVPSVTDVTCNTFGAAIGGYAASKHHLLDQILRDSEQ